MLAIVGFLKKTTIEFDEAKRAAVAAVLGTTGLKATVDAAFDVVLGHAAWQQILERHERGDMELTNDDIEEQAWRV